MKGYVHWIDPAYQEARFMNGYPKGVELASFVVVKALGSSLATAGNLMFLPVGVLGAMCLAKLLGASRPFAMAAGAAYVMVPVNISQAATTYVDSGFASCVIAFVASLLFVTSSLGRQGAFMPWPALPALGASMGMAVASKGTGGLIVVVGLAMLAVHIAAKAFVGRQPGRHKLLAAGFAFVALAGIIATAVGGFWYIRNYLIMGSPLYPAGVNVAGHQIFPGLSVAKMIGTEECAPIAMRHWPQCAKVLFVWAQLGFDGHHVVHRHPPGRAGVLLAAWMRSVDPGDAGRGRLPPGGGQTEHPAELACGGRRDISGHPDELVGAIYALDICPRLAVLCRRRVGRNGPASLADAGMGRRTPGQRERSRRRLGCRQAARWARALMAGGMRPDTPYGGNAGACAERRLGQEPGRILREAVAPCPVA
jgi:hypothetical protein